MVLRFLILPAVFLLAFVLVGKMVQPQAALLVLLSCACFYAGFLLVLSVVSRTNRGLRLFLSLFLGLCLVLVSMGISFAADFDWAQIAPESGVVSASIVGLGLFGLTAANILPRPRVSWNRRTSALVATVVAAILGGALGFAQPVFERAREGSAIDLKGTTRLIHGQACLEVRKHGLDTLFLLDGGAALNKPDEVVVFSGAISYRAGLSLLLHGSDGASLGFGPGSASSVSPGSEPAPMLRGEIVPFHRFFGTDRKVDGLPVFVVKDRHGNRQHLFLVVPPSAVLDGYYGRAVEIPGGTIEAHHNLRFLLTDLSSIVRLGSPLK